MKTQFVRFPVQIAGVPGTVEVEETSALSGEIHRRFVLVDRRVVGQVVYVCRRQFGRAPRYGWRPADDGRAPLGNLAAACRRLILSTSPHLALPAIPGVTYRVVGPDRREGLRLEVSTRRGVAGHVVFVPRRRRLFGRTSWGWRPAYEPGAPLTSREAAVLRLPNMADHTP